MLLSFKYIKTAQSTLNNKLKQGTLALSSAWLQRFNTTYSDSVLAAKLLGLGFDD